MCQWAEECDPQTQHETTCVIRLPDYDGLRRALTFPIIGSFLDIKNGQSWTYRDINKTIQEVYGTATMCHPVRERDLSMTLNEKQLASESNIQAYGKGRLYRLWYWLKIRYGVLTGWFLMTTGFRTKNTNWGKYKSELVANTDYKKFDDKLRQVLSGTTEQR
jgi:hypothetical protein